MIYYNNSKACVIYLKEKNSAYVAIEGFVESITVKEFMTKILELCSKMHIKSILLDSSKLEVLKSQDIDWILNNTYAQFSELPLQRIAYISPQNIFGETSLKKLICKSSCKEFKKFSCIESAESWIYKREPQLL